MAVPKHNDSIYIIVSKPQDSLTLAAIRQLYPASVFVAYPPSTTEERHITAAQRKLKAWAHMQDDDNDERKDRHQVVKWCPFDPFGTKDIVKNNVQNCLEAVRIHVAHNGAANEEEDDDSSSSSMMGMEMIDGILFNSYGAVGDGIANERTGLLPLVEYKLIGNLIFLHTVLDQNVLKEGARVILVGSESARGLPRMGFPIPDLGSSVDSIQSYLTGSAYDIQQKNELGVKISSSYRWEQAYADLCAIGVLYMRRLARDFPIFYFGAVSPGMTKESLNPDNSPSPSLAWRLQLFCFRCVVFPLLQRWEIAKTADEGAQLLVRALLASKISQPPELSWEYPSGTFVGAKGGTGGPVCDQTILEGGKMFLEERLQDLAYQAVQAYLP